MLKLTLPNRNTLSLVNLILDYNGTLAKDGVILPGVRSRLIELSKALDVFVITADTYGNVREHTANIPVRLLILDKEKQPEQKRIFLKNLNPLNCAAVGNGSNDALMLKEAGLALAVIGPEGASLQAMLNADIVVNDILTALDLLLNPARITATLRT